MTTVLVALTVCLLVSGALVFLPMAFGKHSVTGPEILTGFLAQLTAASTGVAVDCSVPG